MPAPCSHSYRASANPAVFGAQHVQSFTPRQPWGAGSAWPQQQHQQQYHPPSLLNNGASASSYPSRDGGNMGGFRLRHPNMRGNYRPSGGGVCIPPPPSLFSPLAAAAARGGHTGGTPGGGMPPQMQDYMERAYTAAHTPEDKAKVEQALKMKLDPLLRSGMAWKLDWTKEPLPTDANFVLGAEPGKSWIPAQHAVRGALRNVRGGGGVSVQPMQQRRVIGGGGGGDSYNANTIPLGERRRLVRSRSRSSGRTASTVDDNEDNGSTSKNDGGNRRIVQNQPQTSRINTPRKSRFDHTSNENTNTNSHDVMEIDPSTGLPTHFGGGNAAQSSNQNRNLLHTLQNRLGNKKQMMQQHMKKKNNRMELAMQLQQEQQQNDEGGGAEGGQPGQKKLKMAQKFSMENTIETARARAQRAARFTADNTRRPGGTASMLASRVQKPRILYVDEGGWSLDYGQGGASDEIDLTQFKIVGTSQQLEKPYLRLTAAPDPSQVRPPHILRLALNRVKDKFMDDESNYQYACEQLKSIRQDLTVQGIRDDLTVEVYETHARIALEKGDRGEFNQCQTQLSVLHHKLNCRNKCEFIAYRLMYNMALNNAADVLSIISDLHRSPTTRAEAESDECISYALRVRRAWNAGDYARMFALYADYQRSPRMCTYVFDWIVPRQRLLALTTIAKAYRPHVTVKYVARVLAFKNESTCLSWLNKLTVPLVQIKMKIDNVDRQVWAIECKDVKVDVPDR